MSSYQNSARPVCENEQRKDQELALNDKVKNCNGIIVHRYRSKQMLFLLFGGIMMIIAMIFIGSHQSQGVVVVHVQTMGTNLLGKVRQCGSNSDCDDGYICEKSGPNRCKKRSDQTDGADCAVDHDCAIGYSCAKDFLQVTGHCHTPCGFGDLDCPSGLKCKVFECPSRTPCNCEDSECFCS